MASTVYFVFSLAIQWFSTSLVVMPLWETMEQLQFFFWASIIYILFYICCWVAPKMPLCTSLCMITVLVCQAHNSLSKGLIVFLFFGDKFFQMVLWMLDFVFHNGEEDFLFVGRKERNSCSLFSPQMEVKIVFFFFNFKLLLEFLLSLYFIPSWGNCLQVYL